MMVVVGVVVGLFEYEKMLLETGVHICVSRNVEGSISPSTECLQTRIPTISFILKGIQKKGREMKRQGRGRREITPSGERKFG